MKSRQMQQTDFILPNKIMNIIVSYYGEEDKPELANKRCEDTVYWLIKYPTIKFISVVRYKASHDGIYNGEIIAYSVLTIIAATLGASLATIAVPTAALVDHYNQKKMQSCKDKITFFKPFRHHNTDKSLSYSEKDHTLASQKA